MYCSTAVLPLVAVASVESVTIISVESVTIIRFSISDRLFVPLQTFALLMESAVCFKA